MWCAVQFAVPCARFFTVFTDVYNLTFGAFSDQMPPHSRNIFKPVACETELTLFNELIYYLIYPMYIPSLHYSIIPMIYHTNTPLFTPSLYLSILSSHSISPLFHYSLHHSFHHYISPSPPFSHSFTPSFHHFIIFPFLTASFYHLIPL